jgi:dsDNA-specific endonuclease/ATPase MutS2
MVDEESDQEEPFVVPIEESIDLHGFRPRDIVGVVESYLEAAAEKGYREVRLIHGRGKGVQRAGVQRFLASHPLVEEFFDAPPGRGGWGATVVRLRRGARERPD